jgi:hypothetical protein
MGINSFTIDLLLSGFVYVMLTYLTFILMKKKRRHGDDSDNGGQFHLSPPEIDLPPGVTWPGDSPKQPKKQLVEEA